ncbi:MAG: DNA polymerase I, partial [Clostridia bacterium]|nr:DNA polymerase I [Clostridia bacterium]
AKNLKVPPKTAAGYINKYFELYPEVKEYMNRNVAFAKESGYARTHFGRKRYIREINATNYNLRTFGERAAMNMPLQGAAADIIKIAMLNVFNRLKGEGLQSKLILQVHDELIIDAYKTEAAKVEEILKFEMENAVKLAVPLTVSLSVSENWFDAK